MKRYNSFTTTLCLQKNNTNIRARTYSGNLSTSVKTWCHVLILLKWLSFYKVFFFCLKYTTHYLLIFYDLAIWYSWYSECWVAETGRYKRCSLFKAECEISKSLPILSSGIFFIENCMINNFTFSRQFTSILLENLQKSREFVMLHYNGEVRYSIDDWVEKNRSFLDEGLTVVLSGDHAKSFMHTLWNSRFCKQIVYLSCNKREGIL